MNLTDVTAAARLIRYALTTKDRPSGDGQYRVLLDRYRTNTEFAEVVGRVADGLGLDVRMPTQLGLLIAGHADSPFAVTLDNSGLPIRTQHKLQDRRCFGLLLVALVAYAYPNGEALVDTTNPTVRALELERFLTRHITLAIEAADDSDDEMDRQLGEAARTWLDLPEVLPSERGGLRRDCRRDYVQRTPRLLGRAGTGPAGVGARRRARQRVRPQRPVPGGHLRGDGVRRLRGTRRSLAKSGHRGGVLDVPAAPPLPRLDRIR